MNNDLISREWLEDAFDNLCCHNCKTCRNFIIEDSFYKCDLIDKAPTVEVPENEVNCVLTLFGKCSYNETGCSDCELKDKIRKALKERPQGTSDCIPVKDLINYIRNCREELFEKMKDYNLREFEIRDSMLTNFEQLVRLASSKYKDDMRGRE